MAIEAYNIASAVTTSNTVDLPGGICDALWVGGTGAITGVMEGGGSVVITAVPAGSLLPIKFKRINATGTTATVIVALYQR
jgi:hypothetical protein